MSKKTNTKPALNGDVPPSGDDLNKKALALMQEVHDALTEEEFEFVEATLVAKASPGVEAKTGIPVQNITVEYNGETRRIALKGATIIIKVLQTFDKETKAIVVPWASAIPGKYTMNKEGVYWAYA